MKLPKMYRHSRLVSDFLDRWEAALEQAKTIGHMPEEFARPQETLDLQRVSTFIYRGHYRSAPPWPLLCGLSLHQLGAWLFTLMYPQGDWKAVVQGYVPEFGCEVQGHPDYIVPATEKQPGFIIELKTVRWGKWQQVQKAIDRKHVKQLRTYMILAGYNVGLLVYLNVASTNGDIYVYEVRNTRRMRQVPKKIRRRDTRDSRILVPSTTTSSTSKRIRKGA